MKKWMIIMTVFVLVLAGCGNKAEMFEPGTTDLVSEETSDLGTGTNTNNEQSDLGTGTNSSQSDLGTGTNTEEETPEVIPAPDFTIYDKEGNPITLSDYRGKIVFVNFFTTWCKYCLQEMPDLQAARDKYKDDLEVIIVDVFSQEKISETEVYDWYDALNLDMPMGIDTEGFSMRDYYVPAFPTTFFIDREGNVLAYYPGAMNAELIDEVMAIYGVTK